MVPSRNNLNRLDIPAVWKLSLRNCGALLSLPNGGIREDIICAKVIGEYIRDHAASWFNWAQTNGLGVENLIFVTGCTLVTS